MKVKGKNSLRKQRENTNKWEYVEKEMMIRIKIGLSPLVGLGWMQGSDLRESLRTSDKILRVLLVTLHPFSAYTPVGNLYGRYPHPGAVSGGGGGRTFAPP